jgi:hypothetical protein
MAEVDKLEGIFYRLGANYFRVSRSSIILRSFPLSSIRK